VFSDGIYTVIFEKKLLHLKFRKCLNRKKEKIKKNPAHYLELSLTEADHSQSPVILVRPFFHKREIFYYLLAWHNLLLGQRFEA
jgi:hypothetical protein